MKFKLLIWDFDGVIADTEKLWVENRRLLLNEKFGLNWDFTTAKHYIAGMSDKTKREVLDGLGIITDDSFWDEAMERDYARMAKGFALTEGITKIFDRQEIRQCVATGGTRSKTKMKVDVVGLDRYFDDSRIFTADMVEKGKPEPDLFLLAAEKSGVSPQDCVVIEDSIAGMTAGLKAGMTVCAFGAYEEDRESFIKKVKSLGIENIFFAMDNFEKFLAA